MKKLGIIGGMGPLATAEFFSRIIAHTKAYSDQEHIDIVISNHASLPDRTRIILECKKEVFLDAIAHDFQLMNYAKVEAIAIPCNTSHYFFDDFSTLTEIPVINMVEQTVKRIEDKAIVLGTQGTLQAHVYDLYANKHNKTLISLDSRENDLIMQVIYDIKKGNNNTCQPFIDLLHKYVSNGIMPILACTELSCIELPLNLKTSVIDAMDVLVYESIRACDKEYI